MIFIKLNFHQVIGISIFFLLLFDFINKFGNQFIFVEIIALIAWIQGILSPILFEIAGFSMPVSYSVYFSYAIPATILFITGMYLPVKKYVFYKNPYSHIKFKLITYLKGKEKTGIILIIIGIISWILQPYTSSGLSYLVGLIAYFLLIGICFLIFSEFRNKFMFISISFLLMISTTLINGMIGVLVFWLLIIFIYFSLYRPIRIIFPLKIILFLISIWFIGILQSAKTEYRQETWNITNVNYGNDSKRDIKGNPILLLNLVVERIIDPSKILNNENTLHFIARLNQGYLVAMAMKYVPKRQEFGNGDVTIISTLQAFIPRIFWSEKPTVGTGEYFAKYTGVRLGKYHSATLGALGDAYIDYGKYGGVFLFILGLIIGLIFRYFLNSSLEKPTYILWFILIFYFSLTVSEISVPFFLNAMLKIIIYLIIIRFIFKNILMLKV